MLAGWSKHVNVKCAFVSTHMHIRTCIHVGRLVKARERQVYICTYTHAHMHIRICIHVGRLVKARARQVYVCTHMHIPICIHAGRLAEHVGVKGKEIVNAPENQTDHLAYVSKLLELKEKVRILHGCVIKWNMYICAHV
jgi:hypothetical protein